MSGVKSALRTLAILEYLRQCRPSTLVEIAQGMGMPISSTAALLKTLTAAGYLNYAPEDRRYRASFRIALLGESVDENPSLGEGPLTDRLRELKQLTGETVIAGLQNGAFLQYIHVIAAERKLLQRLPVGKMRLMGYNPMGRILLAHLDLRRATSILRHNNANWTIRRPDWAKLIYWHQCAKAERSAIRWAKGSPGQMRLLLQ